LPSAGQITDILLELDGPLQDGVIARAAEAERGELETDGDHLHAEVTIDDGDTIEQDQEEEDIQGEFDGPVPPVTIRFQEVLVKQFIGQVRNAAEVVQLDHFAITATSLSEFTRTLDQKICGLFQVLATFDKASNTWKLGPRPDRDSLLMIPAYIHIKRSSRNYTLIPRRIPISDGSLPQRVFPRPTGMFKP
jgi:hypothetical protein